MIYEKLYAIQQELISPKSEWNDFSKFKYRSAELILKQLKPLLQKNNCILTLSDSLELIGDRYYIKAEVSLTDIESSDCIKTYAFAREEDVKKGMDGSQITGTASSYARKYALNGLFAIDDRKDNDSNEVSGLEDAEDKELEIFRQTCESMNLDYAKVWKATGKVKDKSRKHLADAQRWLKDYSDVTREV